MSSGRQQASKVPHVQVSRSRHIDTLSSGRPRFMCTGVSLPFCLYRNQIRYERLLTNAVVGYEDDWGNVITSRKEEYFRDLAPYRQSLAFTRSSDPEEFPFPVRTLHDALYAENYERGHDILQRKVADTIIDCQHYDKSLIVHVGGRYMDTLILRETRLCRPGLQTGVPAFTLSLGKGENIVQVSCVTTTRWNACSHILARTNSQLFHVRTVSLSDEMPKTSVKYDVLGRSTIVLEPLQQWDFPSNIIDLSVHPSRGMCTAFISCRNGSLYSWSASEGIKEVHQGSAYQEAEWHSLCASRHPIFCYQSRGPTLYGVDTRSSVEKSIFTDTTSLSALCHHTSPHHLFICNASSSMSVLDIRFPKRYVFQKFIGEIATNMKFLSTLALDVNPLSERDLRSVLEDPLNGIVTTRCSKSQNILLHSFQLGTTKYEAGKFHPSALYSMSQPFEMQQGSINSDTSSIPVIDRRQPHVRNTGALLVPCARYSPGEAERNGNIFFNALLLQQSSIGDVHAQRIEVKSPDEILWAVDTEINDAEHPLQFNQVNPAARNSRNDIKAEQNVPLKYRKKARKEGSHSYHLYQGLTLKNNIFDTDLCLATLPVSCADIVPPRGGMAEDHDVVDTQSENEKEKEDLILMKLDKNGIKEALNGKLGTLFGGKASCTLWELIKALGEQCNTSCDWNDLRDILVQSNELDERLLPPMRTMESFEAVQTATASFINVSGKGKRAFRELTKIREELLGEDGMPRIRQCQCVDGMPGLCELGAKCLRLHRYIYTRKAAFSTSNKNQQKVPSSTSSSSPAAPPPAPATMKIGDETLDVTALISQLKKEWDENEKKLRLYD